MRLPLPLFGKINERYPYSTRTRLILERHNDQLRESSQWDYGQSMTSKRYTYIRLLLRNSLFEEFISCTLCSSNVCSSNSWMRQICDRDDRTFGAGMYLLAHAMYSRIELCDYLILLLALELYLFYTPPSILRGRINLVWDHRGSAASLANFLSAHEEWFNDDNPI